MPIIVDVYAREVLDSRGNPTVEVFFALWYSLKGRFKDRTRSFPCCGSKWSFHGHLRGS